MLEKLLGLATIGSTLASVSLLHRLLSRLAIILALTIISALMVGVLLMGFFYGIYYGLTVNGLAPEIAMLLVGILILLLTAGLIWATLLQLHATKAMHPTPIKQAFPTIGFVGDIVDSFIDGFHSSRNSSRRD